MLLVAGGRTADSRFETENDLGSAKRRGNLMGSRALAMALGVVTIGAPGASAAFGAVNVDKLSATLNAKQEIPKQTFTVTGATGKFTATIVGRKLTWKLTFQGTSGPVLAAHIHLGKVGKANPVPAVPLCAPCRSGATGKVTVTNAVERAIDAGGAYVNVHTKKNQAGEIRGQIKVIEQ